MEVFSFSERVPLVVWCSAMISTTFSRVVMLPSWSPGPVFASLRRGGRKRLGEKMLVVSTDALQSDSSSDQLCVSK